MKFVLLEKCWGLPNKLSWEFIYLQLVKLGELNQWKSRDCCRYSTVLGKEHRLAIINWNLIFFFKEYPPRELMSTYLLNIFWRTDLNFLIIFIFFQSTNNHNTFHSLLILVSRHSPRGSMEILGSHNFDFH